jgi:hypothetical protein
MIVQTAAIRKSLTVTIHTIAANTIVQSGRMVLQMVVCNEKVCGHHFARSPSIA